MGIDLGSLVDRLNRPTSILPLVLFRIAFGVLMFISILRFWIKGWINELYIAPEFHFSYLGFSWIEPLPGEGMYVVFCLLAVLCVLIMLGLFYRVSIVCFFLLFTYVELIDKAYYLNHYYFISLISFLLILLPLNRNFSLDALIRPSIKTQTVPFWTIGIIRLQLGLVYFFAGFAKLKYDWMFEALPLKLWLPANTAFPVIGSLFDQVWFAYAMSWAGAFYDLTIPFWLLWKRSRLYAYLAVIVFHVITWMLFHIGMFPWIMIVCTLVFFTEEDIKKLASKLNIPVELSGQTFYQPRLQKVLLILLGFFFLIQTLLPLRHFLYPGNVCWNEEGFRFAWHVMLVEKTGHVEYRIMDPESGKTWTEYPGNYLNAFQEKQMSFQPDMILEFAHYFKQRYVDWGYPDAQVFADVWVSLNGRKSERLVDGRVDLSEQPQRLGHKGWLLN